MKYLFSLILCLMLLSQISISGIYVDTFENRRLSDWKDINVNDSRPVNWKVFNGEVRVESKDSDTRILVLKDTEWTNYEVELSVMPLKRHGQGHIVLASRVTSTRAIVFSIGDIFWNAPISIATGTILNLENGRLEGTPLQFAKIRNLQNGNKQQVKIDDILRVGVDLPCNNIHPYPFLQTHEWTHLKLMVSGDLFMFWVNEELILNTKCNLAHLAFLKGDLVTGSIGFGIAGYTALFDNFVVSGEEIPNRGRLPVRPQEKLGLTWGKLKVGQ